MATGAGLVEWEQTHGKKKTKCVLTSTGLLMEGRTGLYNERLQRSVILWPPRQLKAVTRPGLYTS